MNGKEIENYNIQECYDELKQLENPNLPPIQSMYHDMALDVITNRKQRIKKRLSQFDQALTELSTIKQRAEEKKGELMQWVNIDSIDNFFIFSNDKRIRPEVIKNYQNTISIINYIIKGESK